MNAADQTLHPSQQELIGELLRPQPTVIALEGGPCGGKSTLMTEVETAAESSDRDVVVIPEVASGQLNELARAGLSMNDVIFDKTLFMDFQTKILAGIISEIEGKKQEHQGTDAIILIDRCDIGAYVSQDEYRLMLERLGKTVAPLHEYVDKLYYLPSIAQIDPGKYDELKAGNGSLRYENAATAALTCARNLAAVSSHPELQVAWGGDFAANIQKFARSILQPDLEGEIKQDVDQEEAQEIIAESELLNIDEIQQSYHRLDGRKFRLRRQSNESATSYFFTVKEGEGVVRTEIQRRLTADQYKLLRQVAQIGSLLVKKRFTFLEDAADDGGFRRMWSADNYLQPGLPFWHFEIDVDSQDEAQEIDLEYEGIRVRATLGAEDLIFYGQKS